MTRGQVILSTSQGSTRRDQLADISLLAGGVPRKRGGGDNPGQRDQGTAIDFRDPGCHPSVNYVGAINTLSSMVINQM
jgi:hypothetical protein